VAHADYGTIGKGNPTYWKSDSKSGFCDTGIIANSVESSSENKSFRANGAVLSFSSVLERNELSRNVSVINGKSQSPKVYFHRWWKYAHCNFQQFALRICRGHDGELRGTVLCIRLPGTKRNVTDQRKYVGYVRCV